MDIGSIITTILWIAIIGWAIFELVQMFRRRNAAEALTNEKFQEDIRKAQVIDVREKDEFKNKHILGARNIPYTQMKQRANELRNDQPIYLYEDKKMLSLRSALVLKKNGFDNIYYLKDGFNKWDGRVKESKTF